MKLKTAQFITIMLFALVTGVFWGTWFSLSRSIAEISPELFLGIGKAIIKNLAVPMRILTPLALLSTLPVLSWMPQKRSGAFVFMSAGLLLMMGATLVTVFIEVPIDNQLKQWTITSLPANWQMLRDRWELYHTVRTFVSLAALASVVLGSLAARPDQKLGAGIF
jgi:uncharacterized membrane protein